MSYYVIVCHIILGRAGGGQNARLHPAVCYWGAEGRQRGGDGGLYYTTIYYTIL